MSYLDSLWRETLDLVGGRDWRVAEGELLRKLQRLKLSGQLSPEASDAVSLITGTLQQKFGDLARASQNLILSSQSRDALIARESIVHLAKVEAQQGDFAAATAHLSQLWPSQTSRAIWENPSGVSVSTMWRLGYSLGMNGESKFSQYWFDRHRDAIVGSHGSQRGNNLLFSGLLELNRNFSAESIHDSCMSAIDNYLTDGLSVRDVKYLSVSKSIVVPLMIESVLLSAVRQEYDAVVQALLARRLLQYDGIPANAEGVADALSSLKRVPDGRLIIGVVSHLNRPEEQLAAWLGEYLDSRPLAIRALDESEDRFKDFLRSRDYSSLLIVDAKFPTVPRGRSGSKPVFFAWGGRREAGLELAHFLILDVGLRIIGFDLTGEGSGNRIDILDEAARSARAAVIHVSELTLFEAGSMRSSLGQHRVLFLRSANDESGLRFGLPAVEVDEHSPIDKKCLICILVDLMG